MRGRDALEPPSAAPNSPLNHLTSTSPPLPDPPQIPPIILLPPDILHTVLQLAASRHAREACHAFLAAHGPLLRIRPPSSTPPSPQTRPPLTLPSLATRHPTPHTLDLSLAPASALPLLLPTLPAITPRLTSLTTPSSSPLLLECLAALHPLAPTLTRLHIPAIAAAPTPAPLTPLAALTALRSLALPLPSPAPDTLSPLTHLTKLTHLAVLNWPPSTPLHPLLRLTATQLPRLTSLSLPRRPLPLLDPSTASALQLHTRLSSLRLKYFAGLHDIIAVPPTILHPLSSLHHLHFTHYSDHFSPMFLRPFTALRTLHATLSLDPPDRHPTQAALHHLLTAAGASPHLSSLALSINAPRPSAPHHPGAPPRPPTLRPTALGTLTTRTLTKLSLNSICLPPTTVASLTQHPTLSHLSIKHCPLDSPIHPPYPPPQPDPNTPSAVPLLTALSTLPALTHLSLSHLPSIDDTACKALAAAAPRLQTLKLVACEGVTTAGLAHLCTLNRLTHLKLDSMRSAIGPGCRQLARLEFLEYLDLTASALDVADAQYFGTQPPRLVRCWVGPLGAEWTAPDSRLEAFWMRLGWNCDVVQRCAACE